MLNKKFALAGERHPRNRCNRARHRVSGSGTKIDDNQSPLHSSIEAFVLIRIQSSVAEYSEMII
jgi:hypothetical protein